MAVVVYAARQQLQVNGNKIWKRPNRAGVVVFFLDANVPKAAT